ncbi:hypothetical protein PQS31_14100 [Luteimonas sp BLCC-B24]|uniref:hypothetical protein n=1 Tax=Luteimonas sp. BLCC-B24 TaxID=3025317 RepID=UPI00234DA620|nr:hypothetical protein [Luteimonas sp. BLCC-B24]MDC7807942.1 hypothetical protein [Luteimonas sp. BLCC-B24]
MFLVVALAGLAFANAALYISQATIPFVTSDGWYFVDAFLHKYYTGGIGLQDLYLKRSTDDHAQPIQKLLLIWNAEYFDLDFVIEAYVGLGFAAIAWGLMLWVAARDNLASGAGRWWILPMVASAASFVSLSSGMVFNWSLVTLGYLGPLAMCALAIAAWQVIERDRWLPVLLIAPLVVFTQDGSGLICVLAVACAVMLREAKLRFRGWRSALALLVLLLVTVALYRWLSLAHLHPGLGTPAAAPLTAMLDAGWRPLLQMMVSVAAQSVVDRGAARLLPVLADPAHQLLGLLVIAAHAWFWLRALRDSWNRTQFLAVSLMLFCYGATAGIIISRVPTFGPDYIFQPRYVMLYQLGTVALALMSAGSDRRHWGRMQTALLSAMLAGIILVQVPLSKATWNAAPYVQAYGNTLGRQMILLGKAPALRPVSCAPILVICEAGRDERIRSIELLREHRLNAFSETMRSRYAMERLAEPAGPVELVPAPDGSP